MGLKIKTYFIFVAIATILIILTVLISINVNSWITGEVKNHKGDFPQNNSYDNSLIATVTK